MSGVDRDALIAELQARVDRLQRTGAYDAEWLTAEVEVEDAMETAVDRYLQTPPVGLRRMARDPLGARTERILLEGRLREAITWLKLSLDAEIHARGAGDAALVEAIDSLLSDEVAARLGGLERDLQALGFAHGERIHRLEDDRRWIGAMAMRADHPDVAAPGTAAMLDLAAVEARAFSQNGEDGIILHLLSVIGVTDRRFVEIGVEDGSECNTANLALNFGWTGTMIDVDREAVEGARRRFAARPQTDGRVRVVEARVTRDNIEELVGAEAGGEDLDLLSIDIDGNDLWVWEALTAVRPRLVVIEYNGSFGPDRSASVPYDPDFDRLARHASGYYHGASVTALHRTARRKGYVLAGCDSNGVNAFFVRADCAEGLIPDMDPAAAWRPVRERSVMSAASQLALLDGLPLDEIP